MADRALVSIFFRQIAVGRTSCGFAGTILPRHIGQSGSRAGFHAFRFAVAKEAIAATKKVFTDMDIPTKLREVGIPEDSLETMAGKLNIPEAYVPLTSKDVLEIYKACY